MRRIWWLGMALLCQASATQLGARALALRCRHVPPAMQQRQSECIEIDLGDEGEPKGRHDINFKPLLPRSEIFQLNLGLPLGMLIEVEDDGGGSVAGRWYQKTRVLVTDALPGYSSYRQVRKGDILRAVSAYRMVVTSPDGFNALKQLASYTPVGETLLRRLIFRCDGASYNDVRDAIASHREGNSIATLVIERPLDPPDVEATDDRPEDAAPDDPSPTKETTVLRQSSAAVDEVELQVSAAADDVDDSDDSGGRKARMAALLSSVAVPVAGAAAVLWNYIT